MRIECPRGCSAMLTADMPVAKYSNVYQFSAERFAELRAETDRVVGHAITEAVLAHLQHGCPAARGAETNECGATSPMGYTCNRQPGHPPDHEHQVIDTDDAGNETTRTIASWPTLEAVH